MNTLSLFEKRDREIKRLGHLQPVVEHHRIEQALWDSEAIPARLTSPTRAEIEEHLILRRIIADLQDMLQGENCIDRAKDISKKAGNQDKMAATCEPLRLDMQISLKQFAHIGDNHQPVSVRLELQEPPHAVRTKPDEPIRLN